MVGRLQVRTVASTGFTVTVQIVGAGAKAGWLQEATVAYVAAAPGKLVGLAGSIAAVADVGPQPDRHRKDQSKTVKITFPTAGSASSAPSACTGATVVLTPMTTRGKSNTDMYAVALTAASCEGATFVAGDVCQSPSVPPLVALNAIARVFAPVSLQLRH
jgi:hypothetical protein